MWLGYGMADMVWYREEGRSVSDSWDGVLGDGEMGGIVDCTSTVLAKIRHLWGISRVCTCDAGVRLVLADELVWYGGLLYIMDRSGGRGGTVVLERDGVLRFRI